MNNKLSNYKYYAFISYRRADAKHARWLKRQLSSYRLTNTMAKLYNVSKTLSPVFLDQDDLLPGELNHEIRKKLSLSKYLIVICSKNTSESSTWVDKEISYFLELGNSPNKIIPLIIDKAEKPEEELYPNKLKELRSNNANFNLCGPSFFDSTTDQFGTNKHKAFLKIVAKMHGIDVSEIRSQDKIIVRNRLIRGTVIATIFTALLISIIVFITSPTLNFTVNNNKNEIESIIGERLDFTINFKNFNNKDNVETRIQLPECLLPSDNCAIDSNKLDNSIFTSGLEISNYIKNNNTQIKFSATVMNYELKLKKNIFYAYLTVTCGDNSFDDAISITITPPGSNISTSVDWGWGDSNGGRECITSKEYNDGKYDNLITFNRISDGVIGNELNFVAAKTDNSIDSGQYNLMESNSITAERGEKYLVRMYLHNLCVTEDNIAKNVRARFIIPKNESKQITVYGMFNSSNATPREYWDSIVFKGTKKFTLSYIPGSAKIENNGIGSNGGHSLEDSIITSKGVLLGYNKLDGDMPGGYTYDAYISIQVRVE